jgi:hypothetical protein
VTVLDDIARLARRVTGDFRFERVWPAVVERVGADGLVDVLPDDAEMRGSGLQGVPMATIDPATQLAPEPGCRCLLGFRDGDPRKPTIVAWEYAQDSATVRLAGGIARVARKGDVIDVLLPMGTPTAVSGVAAGVQTPPLPASPVTVPPTPVTGTVTLATKVYAQPIGGAPRVKA